MLIHKMNSSFYAPVNLDFLEDYSMEVLLYELETRQKHEKQLYSLEVHMNTDADLDCDGIRQIAICANLNPQQVHVRGNNILHGGEVCKLKGRDGYWCWMTPCPSCSTVKTRRCDTLNCSNNILFRRRFIHDG